MLLTDSPLPRLAGRSQLLTRPPSSVGHYNGFRLFWTWKCPHARPGRPAVSLEIRQLIRRLRSTSSKTFIALTSKTSIFSTWIVRITDTVEIWRVRISRTNVVKAIIETGKRRTTLRLPRNQETGRCAPATVAVHRRKMNPAVLHDARPRHIQLPVENSQGRA